VASLTDAHGKEVATLKTYTRALEEQQSQRTLHHASSNHLLLLLDTTEPQTPNRDQSFQNPPSASASSTRSFQTAFEQHTRSPQQPRFSPEMESLKRRLTNVKKPDTGSRDAVRELNQLKTNYAAMQKQVESLMTKLNESKRNERQLQTTLENVEKACSEWQEKVAHLEKAEKALQNTVDHLEGRLELANIEKVDAQEQLLNLQNQRPPYDPMPERPHVPTGRGTHISMSTVFSSGSAGSPVSNNEFQEPKTLAAFIARIERLESEIKEKDEKIQTLERENENIMQDFEEVANDRRILKEVTDKFQFHSDLQKRYVMQGQEVEQLRAMVMHREEVIGEKEKALNMAERQLEHHKLLLHAEIRRHATMSLLANVNQSPLPDLASLASKEDIDRWIERLQKRLKAEIPSDHDEKPVFSTDLEALVADLKREVDFYVREILYYKLDIKGYKSDIKKLQRVAARIGDRGEYDSPTPSLGKRGSSDTPVRSRFAVRTASSGFSATPSPISTGPISATLSIGRPVTPTAAIETPNPSPHAAGRPNAFYRTLAHPSPRTPLTPCTPPRRAGFNLANEADHINPGISPRSVARLSPERRKPTPPSPEQEQRGHLATNFPLSTPASPKRQDTQRSMSESIIQMYSSPRTPDWNQPADDRQTPESASRTVTASRGRSSSLPESNRGKGTPDRPPRPRYGLFESPNTANAALDNVPTPPQKDVIAEAERNSPPQLTPKSRARRPVNMSLDSEIPMAATASQQPGRPSTAKSLPDPIPRPLSPKRKDSTGSGSNIPFVISMGSPHNPALITPTTTLPPTPCSITAKCSSGLKLQSGIRAGVGGTMSSTTPVTSPTSPTGGATASYFPATAPKPPAKPSSIPAGVGYGSTRNPTPAHSRNNSTNTAIDSNAGSGTVRGGNAASSTFGHSRSVSGSSFMSAIQLPGSLMKGKGKMRKDHGSGMTISNPKPLASPFDIDSEKGGKYGIGEAI
jgi:archaellum component FlaC